MDSPCKKCKHRHRDKEICIEDGCSKPLKMVLEYHRSCWNTTNVEEHPMPDVRNL